MSRNQIMKREIFILSAAIAVVTVWSLFFAVQPAYATESVQYVEKSWDGTKVVSTTKTANCVPITSDMDVNIGGVTPGWYVVNGDITIDDRLVVWGEANIILTDGSKLTVKDGIKVLWDRTLNIYGQADDSGQLICIADTNNNAAIGSDNNSGPNGPITIHGGQITADAKTDGTDGAGIGAGNTGAGGQITIYGGKVNATGGDYAAGIGAGDADGDGRDGGTVRIYGGEVTAQGGCDGAGIGGGEGASGADVEIWGGTVRATGGSSSSDGGAGIGSGDKDGRTVHGGTVKIYGGEVTAQGGPDGAGIGGGEDASSGDITIRGGEVTASGGDEAAGIGGGNEGDADNAGTISISGGTVIATGGDYGAGIGGGDQQRGGTINITGGDITATGGSHAAGIGGGDEASGGTISISGGTVIATGGEGDRSGAGIGSGRSPKGGGTDPMSITLSGDCDVTATGGNEAAGIGGGNFCWFGEVTIEGGTVVAQGGEGGPGIGNGYSFTCTFHRGDKGISVTITGGNVKATGGSNGAGIGGGHGSISGVIQIDGGTVEATGGDEGAAGIGTGSRCYNIRDGGAASPVGVASVDITINGGSVIAKAGALNTKSNVDYPGVAIGTSGSEQDSAVYRHTYFNGKIALNGGTIKAYAAPVGGDNPGYPNHGMVIGTCDARNFENSAVGNVEFNGATVHMYPVSGSDEVKSQAVLASSVSVNGQRVIYDGITAFKDDRVSTLTSTGKNYVLVEPCTHAEATLVNKGDTHTGTCSHCGFSGEEPHRYSAPTEWNWNNDNTAAMATFQCACGREVSVRAEVTLKEGDDTKYVATATLDGKTYTAEADRLVYDITVEDNEHGSIKVKSTARVGSEVGLDVVPDEHYHLKSVAGKSVAGDDVTLNHVEGNHYTFTMHKGNVTLRAEFDPDTYEVIWKDYDGTALQTDTVTYGESYTLPGADTFTKPEGKCAFKSLELKVGSADAVAKEPGETVEIEGDTAITAVWEDHDWVFFGLQKTRAEYYCSRDPYHTEIIDAEYETKIIAPTCEEKGMIIGVSSISAKNSLDGKAHSKSEDLVNTGDALGHDYSNYLGFTWTGSDANYTDAVLELSCSHDDSHIINIQSDTITKEVVDPTCTAPGYTEYTAKATYNGKTYTDTKRGNSTSKLGHDWGEITYTWADDNSSVTATHVCKRDPSHVETETVETTMNITTPPTCKATGVADFTTKPFRNNAFTEQTKTDQEIPADPEAHVWNDGEWESDNGCGGKVMLYTCTLCSETELSIEGGEDHDFSTEWTYFPEPTCTEGGQRFHECTKCGAFDFNDFDVLDAKGHKWKFVDFTWTGNATDGYEKAVANYVCEHDSSHRMTVDAAIATEVIDPTCEEGGKTVYTASVTASNSPDEAEHRESKDAKNTEAIGHKWHFKDMLWTGDEESGYTKAVAKFVCNNDESHEKLVDANITEKVIEPTCVEPGYIWYRASLEAKDSLTGYEVYDNNVAKIKDATHSWDNGKVTKEATETEEGEKTYTCTVCKGTKTETIPKLDPTPEPEPDPDPTPAPVPSAATMPATTVNINNATASAAVIRQAIQAAGGNADTLVLGKKVKKISKRALAGTGIKTIVVESKKLKKKSVKGSLKGSKVKTVKVKVGNKKTNKKYVKKYKKIFTKKNAGKKVKVKR